jgi:hypothetical protein
MAFCVAEAELQLLLTPWAPLRETHVLKDSRGTAAHLRIKRTQAMSGALSVMLKYAMRHREGNHTYLGS